MLGLSRWAHRPAALAPSSACSLRPPGAMLFLGVLWQHGPGRLMSTASLARQASSRKPPGHPGPSIGAAARLYARRCPAGRLPALPGEVQHRRSLPMRIAQVVRRDAAQAARKAQRCGCTRGTGCVVLDCLRAIQNDRAYAGRSFGSPLGLRAACAASRRTTCADAHGNDRRCWNAPRESGSPASPGTGVPYKGRSTDRGPGGWPAA